MEKVETQLASVLRGSDAFTDEVTQHLALAGGKRLRPLLCFMAAQLGPEPENERVLDAALSVELTHLASLYHDDVMDEAPMRRGVPTAQRLYGNSAAIMAGDVLFSRASATILRVGLAAVQAHVAAFERLCIGQLRETAGPKSGADPIAHYLDVLSGKTGSLIALAARHGVCAAAGDLQLAADLAEYGERIGVAFQLADDVIDLSEDGFVTGKTPGTDLLENVDTMPTLLLKKAAQAGTLDTAGQEILRLLESGEIAADDNLQRALAMLREHEVVAQTKELAAKWAADALSYLQRVPDGSVKDAFVGFAHAMVYRMA
ncbi:polyprenyl synthetase family protein [Arcanobacterium hippocoleae]